MSQSAPFKKWWVAGVAAAVLGVPPPAQAQTCSRTITAEVVALDQPYFWNRLGAVQPHGMMYALKRDVVAISGNTPSAGNAMLRADKRPRPLVLRMGVGDCLQITFYNWLANAPVDDQQAATREASIHAVGLELRNSISDDGSYVGTNASSLVASGGSTVYTFYAEREGPHLIHSLGAMVGGEGDNGTISAGLFGAINVEPASTVWYRSQLTQQEMAWATQLDGSGQPIKTAGNQPLLDYNAVYPTGHPFAGKPILKILDGNAVFHSDLTAIIAGTGTNAAISPDPYPEVGVYPNRNEPFREFTIIFHDEIGAVQAFPEFNNEVLTHTLHSVRDAFAINYGTGGIGAEILANRLGVGPMHQCTECLFEEFFLTSWAVGDPAMIVDVPANAPCTVSQLRQENTTSNPCTPTAGAKATKAFFPEDPSNVYHSYLNDHVKFRNVLAGSDDHHVFHLHAHQWLHTPDGDNSTYLDSQTIGQGAAFTYEIAHEGGGNRNKTVGDSIFHCHFYPHFAMGMWSLWRVHDVFESGTKLDEDGRPIATITQLQTSPGVFTTTVHVSQTRALPDGEIPHGTPIPALVPLPGQPMAPMPQVQAGVRNGQVWLANTSGNPGYPFNIPAVAGHRPPHPPLDFYQDPITSVIHDGGLPRHVITGGTFTEQHNRLSFEKHLLTANAKELTEAGETIEIRAMNFHAQTSHATCLPDGTCDPALSAGSSTSVRFITNGAPAVAGAPYADPCLANPETTGTPEPQRFRTYKGANIQMDVIFNKTGWHFPQQRLLSLWEDVDDFLDNTRAPEPLFVRANTYDCITYLHTNLVPNEYELDDFQVRTPTDILGQHIHLVKFDVTSSDGSANGFNYEDGTFSPEEVRERIDAINANGGLIIGGAPVPLTAQPHPFFGPFGNPDWVGAQTTVQRWYVDDVLNKFNEDRTLRTVFTHDHFGPSTHQQVGLYAALVVEPDDSTWYHNETGVQLGTRHDGGPTTWQAVIEGTEDEDIYREFLFQLADFQHAYLPGSPTTPDETLGFADPQRAVNPPGRVQEWDRLLTDRPWVFEKPFFVGQCPGGVTPPCPEAIAADDPGTMVLNYRNEPVALRVFDPSTGGQATGVAGDYSHVFRSDVTRALTAMNSQPGFYPSLNSGEVVQPKDPFTPLLRAYENDRVQLRLLVGAHEEEHHASVHGVRWLFEPSEPNSGFRGEQTLAISEHFEFEIPNLPHKHIATTGFADFLWKAGGAVDSLWNGTWGILRAYRGTRGDLVTLSNNDDGEAPALPEGFNGICPPGAPVRNYDVAAVAAQDVLPNGTLVYNSRVGSGLQDCTATSSSSVSCTSSGLTGPLHDPTALLYVHRTDLNEVTNNGVTTRTLKPGVNVEPLILRANAGDCVQVTLYNFLPEEAFDLRGYNLMPNIVDRFNINQTVPSTEVGLHAQLVSYDITTSDGFNVGFNPLQTILPGYFATYRWYAGQIVYDRSTNAFTAVPTEFGSINLTTSDPIEGPHKGLLGALIIEPEGTTWTENPNGENPSTRAEADIFAEGGSRLFRELVAIFQDEVNLRYGEGQPVRPTFVQEDAEETGQDGLNYRTEPIWFRKNYLPQTDDNATRQFQFSNALSNSVISGSDPETPIFDVDADVPVRFRALAPSGHSQSHVFGLHGHVWQEEPYQSDSTVLGSNAFSEWKGTQPGHGPGNHLDALLLFGAGGAFGVDGDFLLRDYVPWRLSNGLWSLFRVNP